MSLKSSTLLLHLLTLLHLLYTSSSTPIESRQSSPPLQEFQPLAVLLNNPKIPFIEIIANGGNFWFFKRTTTDPPGHGTGLLATGNNISEISLWSAAPGGQRVYVAPNGALKYNTPNSSTHHSPHPSALFNFNFDTGVDRLAEITYIGRCSRAGGSGFSKSHTTLTHHLTHESKSKAQNYQHPPRLLKTQCPPPLPPPPYLQHAAVVQAKVASALLKLNAPAANNPP